MVAEMECAPLRRRSGFAVTLLKRPLFALNDCFWPFAALHERQLTTHSGLSRRAAIGQKQSLNQT